MGRASVKGPGPPSWAKAGNVEPPVALDACCRVTGGGPVTVPVALCSLMCEIKKMQETWRNCYMAPSWRPFLNRDHGEQSQST